MLRFVSFICLLFFSNSIFAINIEYVDKLDNDDTFCLHTFSVYGTIENNDAEKFSQTVSRLRNKYTTKVCPHGGPSVEIDSQGGSVNEAMKLGRYIKKNRMDVRVSLMHMIRKNNAFDVDTAVGGVCLSACIFVLAGGVQRSADTEFSRVGIHRPYFENVKSNSSVSEIRAEREKSRKIILDYFLESDINPSLLDDMLSIPPGEVRILSKEELRRYRLTVDDANYEEFDNAKSADGLNINAAENRKRKLEADAKCRRNGTTDWDCWRATIFGLSVTEYTRRVEKIKSKCANDNSENAANCRKNIMLLGG